MIIIYGKLFCLPVFLRVEDIFLICLEMIVLIEMFDLVYGKDSKEKCGVSDITFLNVEITFIESPP